MPVFMAILLFLIDIGLVLATQVTMDSAAQAAARQIRVGNMRSASSAPAVRSLVCGKLSLLVLNCANIQVYATSGTSFGALTLAHNVNGALSSTSFNPGTSQSFVLLEIGYYEPLAAAIPGVSEPFLMSTVAFENEE